MYTLYFCIICKPFCFANLTGKYTKLLIMYVYIYPSYICVYVFENLFVFISILFDFFSLFSTGSCGSYQSKTNEITKENLTEKEVYIYI